MCRFHPKSANHSSPRHPHQEPHHYVFNAALLERPGQTDIQLDLFLDYRNNLKLYPMFQKFFRDYHPRTLAIWGKFDPFLIPAGAAAYQKDNPKAVVKMLDAGHFALETNLDDIAIAIDQLLGGE
jgi:pimeloyl-ACP methyl ester carboxylesterase